MAEDIENDINELENIVRPTANQQQHYQQQQPNKSTKSNKNSSKDVVKSADQLLIEGGQGSLASKEAKGSKESPTKGSKGQARLKEDTSAWMTDKQDLLCNPSGKQVVN